MPWLLELTYDRPREFTINVLEEIDSETEAEFLEYSDKIDELQKEVEIMQSLRNEYEDYIDYIISKNDRRTNDILRRVNNYLSTYISFINYWEKYVKNHKDGEYLSFYKKTLSEIYDSSFEYRFLYNLRNYAAHGGQPVSSVSMSLENKTLVKMHRKSFLADYKNMQAPFRRELNNMEIEDLDVDEAIRVTHKNLLDLHNKLFNKTLNSPDEEYLRASVGIMRLQKKFSKYNGNLALTGNETIESIREMAENPSQHPISYKELQVQFAKQIIKGAIIKYKFKGKFEGVSHGFPYIETGLLVEMPKIFEGKKYVDRRGVKWVRVTTSRGEYWEDGFSRYFALYMAEGLTDDEYLIEARKYDLETKALFSN